MHNALTSHSRITQGTVEAQEKFPRRRKNILTLEPRPSAMLS